MGIYRSIFATIVALLSASGLFAQDGALEGRVIDARTREAIPFVNILLEGTTIGATTDIDGAFIVQQVPPGLYNVIASSVGYERKVIFEVQVSAARTAMLQVEMQLGSTELKEVEVTVQPFQRSVESPLSLRTIGTAEIMRFPGGNRDISRVIRSLPGVASTTSFRNDIIIRGGAPNENRFYLDGVEVPTINHFSTQGSSGGPVGLINVNFIREVDVITGAFPAARGNTLSSVFEFKQPDGNTEKPEFTFLAGSSDIAFTFDGPTGRNASTIISVRRSYLQFLFQALRLPFLPTYNDAQIKHKIRLGQKDQLTFIGLGAYDQLDLNPAANDGLTDPERIERNVYILNNIPENTQWNYTLGARWDHFTDGGLHTLVASRSALNNTSRKYRNNADNDPDALLLDYSSGETENKVRYEYAHYAGAWKLVGGVAYEHARYTTDTYTQRIVNDAPTTLSYTSELSMNKYGLFGQASRKFGRLGTSFGLRTDLNDLGGDMSDPLQQLSPRLSLTYALTEKININGNVGRYYQLPPYTTLGYRENDVLVNLDNGIKYIQADHVVLGVEYFMRSNSKISVEGFHKWYTDYPLLVDKGVSLANLGGDFGVVGNESAKPTSDGRAYGVEFLLQQRLYKGFYGIASYTFVRSEFTNASGTYAPSSWDFGHIVNLSGGRRFDKGNWEVGLNWRLQGGQPFTPYDIPTSSLIPVWDANQQGVLDYALVNTERLTVFTQLNMRIDKRWYYEKWTLNVYLDVENLLAGEVPAPAFLDVVRDDAGQPLVDPDDPTRYSTRLVANNSTTVLPSVGIMIEF